MCRIQATTNDLPQSHNSISDFVEQVLDIEPDDELRLQQLQGVYPRYNKFLCIYQEAGFFVTFGRHVSN
jgi:hypothetical protein